MAISRSGGEINRDRPGGTAGPRGRKRAERARA